MKYLCLIYENENAWNEMSKEQTDGVMAEYNAFTEEIGKTGHLVGGEALQPTASATTAVIELNRAAAIAMRDGPERGLVLIDALLEAGELKDYHLAHAAKADLCRRLGRKADAAASYRRALALSSQEPERRFLENCLRELIGAGQEDLRS